MKKLHEGDFFNISIDEHKDATEDVLDAVYGTIEDCKFYVPLQDVI